MVDKVLLIKNGGKMSWQDKVTLLSGEKIVRGQRRERGHMGQTEILPFTITNEKNEVVGSGEYIEHTQIRGLQNSCTLRYSKTDGTKFEEFWEP